MFNRALYSKEGYIGANIVTLQSKFKVDINDIATKYRYVDTTISNFYDLDIEKRSNCNILLDLMHNNKPPGFLQDEIDDLIQGICCM